MTDLIARVRLLIGDPAGASSVFTDQQVQDALEARQCGEDDYDVYAAAADLLEAWAAQEKLAFDFSADGAQYRRSQKVEALLELAAKYRAQQRPQVALQVRGDVW